MKSEKIYITETPRDAMQGWRRFIPADEKMAYINALMKVGFDKVDIGSFVSPKAVPQMADTAEVISSLDVGESRSQVMVIVGNKRGGLVASEYPIINVIGYPYSISSTFLKRNLNTTPEAALVTIMELQQICRTTNKQLQVYLAMAFGNPYNDPWNDDLVLYEAEKLSNLGIKHLAFSDITGEGTPESIGRLCQRLTGLLPSEKMSIHLHSNPGDWQPKVEAAWQAGFRNFEGAIGGFGGCPMTGYELLGNLDTSTLVEWSNDNEILTGLDMEKLKQAKNQAVRLFAQ
jgi:hydroxymethylglutaryl-CoA lyase